MQQAVEVGQLVGVRDDVRKAKVETEDFGEVIRAERAQIDDRTDGDVDARVAVPVRTGID